MWEVNKPPFQSSSRHGAGCLSQFARDVIPDTELNTCRHDRNHELDLPQPRIQAVADPVSQEVETCDQRKNRDSWHDGDPPGSKQ